MTTAELVAVLLFLIAGCLLVSGVFILFGLGWSLIAGSVVVFTIGMLIVRGTRE